jgi:hypothetical protein
VATTIEEAMLEKLRCLSREKQRGFLAFADSLGASKKAKLSLRSPEGLWPGHGVDISEPDIDELRREMWNNFA